MHVKGLLYTCRHWQNIKCYADTHVAVVTSYSSRRHIATTSPLRKGGHRLTQVDYYMYLLGKTYWLMFSTQVSTVHCIHSHLHTGHAPQEVSFVQSLGGKTSGVTDIELPTYPHTHP